MTGSSGGRIGPARGREFWEGMVAGFERSGLSVREFCRQQRISEHTFYNKRKQLRDTMRFALVEARPAPAPDTGIELILGAGERLHIRPGFDPGTLRAVIAALRP